MSVTINTTINGKAVSASAEASTSLLEFLRDTLEMKGSKLCCNTGECGACTVIYNGEPINTCVTMAADAIGAKITTIEGLAEGDLGRQASQIGRSVLNELKLVGI